MSDTPKDGPGRNAEKGGGRSRATQQAAVPPAGRPPAAPAATPPAAAAAPVDKVVAERIPAEPASAQNPSVQNPSAPRPSATLPPAAAIPAATTPAAASSATAPAADRRLALGVPVVAGAAVVVLIAAWMVYASRPEGAPVDAAQLAALGSRVERVEQADGTRGPQLQQLEQRLGGLETAQGNAVKAEAVQALQDRLGQQQQALAAQQSRADGRIAEVDAALAQRLSATEAQLTQRVQAAEASVAPRLAELDNTQQQRLDALRDSLQQRMDTALQAQRDRADAALRAQQDAAQQQQAKDDSRLAALESREQRLAAAEQRLNRLVASTAVTTALEAGQPLGASLAGLPGTVPPALAAYSTAAPPTAAQLRLSFEDASRAARAAAEPQTTGQGVLEAAATRLSNLVTVRRGDQTVWGDNASGALEGARQSLDAGDLGGAVQKVEALPPAARQPMEEWLKQARGLLAARAALAELVAPRGQG